jgi:excinuclease ABC subunit A
LHFDDVNRLTRVLHNFVELGNSVLVIEHNLDMIKNADYIIDMGPEGGSGGGLIVDVGNPESVAQNWEKTGSFTGKYLAIELKSSSKQIKEG